MDVHETDDTVATCGDQIPTKDDDDDDVNQKSANNRVPTGGETLQPLHNQTTTAGAAVAGATTASAAEKIAATPATPASATEDTDYCAICATPTKNRCSRCKLAFYCSAEHQIEYYRSGGHSLVCKPRDSSRCVSLASVIETWAASALCDTSFDVRRVGMIEADDFSVVLLAAAPSPKDNKLVDSARITTLDELFPKMREFVSSLTQRLADGNMLSFWRCVTGGFAEPATRAMVAMLTIIAAEVAIFHRGMQFRSAYRQLVRVTAAGKPCHVAYLRPKEKFVNGRVLVHRRQIPTKLLPSKLDCDHQPSPERVPVVSLEFTNGVRWLFDPSSSQYGLHNSGALAPGSFVPPHVLVPLSSHQLYYQLMGDLLLDEYEGLLAPTFADPRASHTAEAIKTMGQVAIKCTRLFIAQCMKNAPLAAATNNADPCVVSSSADENQRLRTQLERQLKHNPSDVRARSLLEGLNHSSGAPRTISNTRGPVGSYEEPWRKAVKEAEAEGQHVVLGVPPMLYQIHKASIEKLCQELGMFVFMGDDIEKADQSANSSCFWVNPALNY